MTTPPRLHRSTTAPPARIVHFGPGNFFRAFNATLTARANAVAGEAWGIVAVALRSQQAVDQLEPQGGVFTSATLHPDQTTYEIIPSIASAISAVANPAEVLEHLAHPAIQIVSATVTEKGYCHIPSSGHLQVDHPDIVFDLAHPETPRTLIGYIVEALARRRAAGVAPFTVMSCDNLPANGAVMRQVVLDFANQRDAKLAKWIADHVAFPSSMVDRITPATTDADIASLADAEGYLDRAAVVHEPFWQWVIEDRFVAGRPAWDKIGASFVADVAAHEKMKLRCLNGTHSALAYLGYLAGHATIAKTVADPVFAAYCEGLWHAEILPTLETPEGEDLPAYVNALMRRYQNPAIQHRTWQIAMDGSQKLPQRILGTIADALDQGLDPNGLCLAVAGWMRFVGGKDEDGKPIDVRDPMASELQAIVAAQASPEAAVDQLLAMRAIFPEALATKPAFRDRVAAHYLALLERGARQTVADFVA